MAVHQATFAGIGRHLAVCRHLRKRRLVPLGGRFLSLLKRTMHIWQHGVFFHHGAHRKDNTDVQLA